ncbi:hypothetical protein SAMN04487831_11524 [Pseudobutyrivibrio sp. UC1225]|uniref:hypothetical protein n=1 Tax=Pseudobutyrivibrio sp. UC1225 TaxID=1798185 RepID=UPI0008EA8D69|nr:hypothetical protein [Pseudobutyrivibrio sp. UC1225]SFO26931.1 hypothetical protein SAMN04487831_11524 [Pseudobutyrivibrio sp. UC1225]
MKKSKALLYFIIVFLCMAMFFVVLHPIAIFDTDDWENIQHLRLPFPLIKAWNPIKVFPEDSMIFFSYAGAYLLYPIIGRYCFALSVSNGIFISLAIAFYFLEFHLLIQDKYRFSSIKSVAISIIFICLHFVIFAHGDKDNIFLFYAYDMTCIYNYTLCTAINAALVMHMIRCGGFGKFSEYSKKYKFLIAVWVYLSIFSNLYTSIILAVYVGIELMMAMISDCENKKFGLADFYKNNKENLIVLLVWFCSLAIEKTGIRSEGKTTDFFESLIQAISNLKVWGSLFNIVFLIFAGVVILLWCLLAKEKKTVAIVKYLLGFVLTTIYLVLLSAVVSSEYVTRVDVMFAGGFWMLLILMLFVSDLAGNINSSNAILPVLAVVILCCTIYVSNSYKEINYCNISYEKCEALADDIISQFKVAEENGQTEIELVVPKFDTKDNWPYGTYASERFTNVMYRHGIINGKINVKALVPSEEKTRAYITQ